MNLTPDQELVFQVLAAVAWADERLNPEEIRLLLDQLVTDFAPPRNRNNSGASCTTDCLPTTTWRPWCNSRRRSTTGNGYCA